jgi:FMN-dependent NADH-azoreductase
MPRLLFVHASPRGPRSESLAVAETLLGALGPSYEIDRLDLFATPPALFTGDAVAAKMEVISGEAVSAAHEDAWADALALADRIGAADTLLFTVPMWNHGIPWMLKMFIDSVTQPGVAFGFDPETGYSGLLGDAPDGRRRRAIAIYTSAVYSPGVPPAFGVDFHSTYFEDWLRFVGIEDITALRLQTTWPGPDFDVRRATAHAEAAALGARLSSEAVAA